MFNKTYSRNSLEGEDSKENSPFEQNIPNSSRLKHTPEIYNNLKDSMQNNQNGRSNSTKKQLIETIKNFEDAFTQQKEEARKLLGTQRSQNNSSRKQLMDLDKLNTTSNTEEYQNYSGHSVRNTFQQKVFDSENYEKEDPDTGQMKKKQAKNMQDDFNDKILKEAEEEKTKILNSQRSFAKQPAKNIAGPLVKKELHQLVLRDDLKTILFMCQNEPINVNMYNDNQETALHLAVKKGRKNAVQLLLSLGANPNKQDKNLLTPIHICCAKKLGNNAPVAKLLIEESKIKVDLNLQDDSGNTAAHLLAMRSKNLEIGKLLVENGADLSILNYEDETVLDVIDNMEFDRQETFVLLLLQYGSSFRDITFIKLIRKYLRRNMTQLIPPEKSILVQFIVSQYQIKEKDKLSQSVQLLLFKSIHYCKISQNIIDSRDQEKKDEQNVCQDIRRTLHTQNQQYMKQVIKVDISLELTREASLNLQPAVEQILKERLQEEIRNRFWDHKKDILELYNDTCQDIFQKEQLMEFAYPNDLDRGLGEDRDQELYHLNSAQIDLVKTLAVPIQDYNRSINESTYKILDFLEENNTSLLSVVKRTLSKDIEQLKAMAVELEQKEEPKYKEKRRIVIGFTHKIFREVYNDYQEVKIDWDNLTLDPLLNYQRLQQEILLRKRLQEDQAELLSDIHQLGGMQDYVYHVIQESDFVQFKTLFREDLEEQLESLQQNFDILDQQISFWTLSEENLAQYYYGDQDAPTNLSSLDSLVSVKGMIERHNFNDVVHEFQLLMTQLGDEISRKQKQRQSLTFSNKNSLERISSFNTQMESKSQGKFTSKIQSQKTLTNKSKQPIERTKSIMTKQDAKLNKDIKDINQLIDRNLNLHRSSSQGLPLENSSPIQRQKSSTQLYGQKSLSYRTSSAHYTKSPPRNQLQSPTGLGQKNSFLYKFKPRLSKSISPSKDSKSKLSPMYMSWISDSVNSIKLQTSLQQTLIDQVVQVKRSYEGQGMDQQTQSLSKKIADKISVEKLFDAQDTINESQLGQDVIVEQELQIIEIQVSQLNKAIENLVELSEQVQQIDQMQQDEIIDEESDGQISPVYSRNFNLELGDLLQGVDGEKLLQNLKGRGIQGNQRYGQFVSQVEGEIEQIQIQSIEANLIKFILTELNFDKLEILQDRIDMIHENVDKVEQQIGIRQAEIEQLETNIQNDIGIQHFQFDDTQTKDIEDNSQANFQESNLDKESQSSYNSNSNYESMLNYLESLAINRQSQIQHIDCHLDIHVQTIQEIFDLLEICEDQAPEDQAQEDEEAPEVERAPNPMSLLNSNFQQGIRAVGSMPVRNCGALPRESLAVPIEEECVRPKSMGLEMLDSLQDNSSCYNSLNQNSINYNSQLIDDNQSKSYVNNEMLNTTGNYESFLSIEDENIDQLQPNSGLTTRQNSVGLPQFQNRNTYSSTAKQKSQDIEETNTLNNTNYNSFVSLEDELVENSEETNHVNDPFEAQNFESDKLRDSVLSSHLEVIDQMIGDSNSTLYNSTQNGESRLSQEASTIGDQTLRDSQEVREVKSMISKQMSHDRCQNLKLLEEARTSQSSKDSLISRENRNEASLANIASLQEDAGSQVYTEKPKKSADSLDLPIVNPPTSRRSLSELQKSQIIESFMKSQKASQILKLKQMNLNHNFDASMIFRSFMDEPLTQSQIQPQSNVNESAELSLSADAHPHNQLIRQLLRNDVQFFQNNLFNDEQSPQDKSTTNNSVRESGETQVLNPDVGSDLKPKNSFKTPDSPLLAVSMDPSKLPEGFLNPSDLPLSKEQAQQLQEVQNEIQLTQQEVDTSQSLSTQGLDHKKSSIHNKQWQQLWQKQMQEQWQQQWTSKFQIPSPQSPLQQAQSSPLQLDMTMLQQNWPQQGDRSLSMSPLQFKSQKDQEQMYMQHSQDIKDQIKKLQIMQQGHQSKESMQISSLMFDDKALQDLKEQMKLIDLQSSFKQYNLMSDSDPSFDFQKSQTMSKQIQSKLYSSLDSLQPSHHIPKDSLAQIQQHQRGGLPQQYSKEDSEFKDAQSQEEVDQPEVEQAKEKELQAAPLLEPGISLSNDSISLVQQNQQISPVTRSINDPKPNYKYSSQTINTDPQTLSMSSSQQYQSTLKQSSTISESQSFQMTKSNSKYSPYSSNDTFNQRISAHSTPTEKATVSMDSIQNLLLEENIQSPIQLGLKLSPIKSDKQLIDITQLESVPSVTSQTFKGLPESDTQSPAIHNVSSLNEFGTLAAQSNEQLEMTKHPSTSDIFTQTVVAPEQMGLQRASSSSTGVVVKNLFLQEQQQQAQDEQQTQIEQQPYNEQQNQNESQPQHKQHYKNEKDEVQDQLHQGAPLQQQIKGLQEAEGAGAEEQTPRDFKQSLESRSRGNLEQESLSLKASQQHATDSQEYSVTLRNGSYLGEIQESQQQSAVLRNGSERYYEIDSKTNHVIDSQQQSRQTEELSPKQPVQQQNQSLEQELQLAKHKLGSTVGLSLGTGQTQIQKQIDNQAKLSNPQFQNLSQSIQDLKIETGGLGLTDQGMNSKELKSNLDKAQDSNEQSDLQLLSFLKQKNFDLGSPKEEPEPAIGKDSPKKRGHELQTLADTLQDSQNLQMLRTGDQYNFDKEPMSQAEYVSQSLQLQAQFENFEFDKHNVIDSPFQKQVPYFMDNSPQMSYKNSLRSQQIDRQMSRRFSRPSQQFSRQSMASRHSDVVARLSEVVSRRGDGKSKRSEGLRKLKSSDIDMTEERNESINMSDRIEQEINPCSMSGYINTSLGGTIKSQNTSGSNYEIPIQEITQIVESSQNLISNGSFGEAYKGFRAYNPQLSFEGDIIIKVMESRDPNKVVLDEREFQELAIQTCQIDHEGFTRMIAYSRQKDTGKKYLIYQYQSGMCLQDIVEKLRLRKIYDIRMRLEIILQICDALKYAHDMDGYFVGYLKINKVIIDQHQQAKMISVNLPNFFTYIADSDEFSSSDCTWSQPEDIYNLGIIILSLMTGKVQSEPDNIVVQVSQFLENQGNEKIIAGLLDNSAGKWPLELALNLFVLGLNCVATNDDDRECAYDIYLQLQDLQNEYDDVI